MLLKVGIMSIGDELMDGLTIDTNSTWIAEKISHYKSLIVQSKVSVSDDVDSILKNVNYFIKNNYTYIFITGGLGPTHDDITKHALCIYFKCKVILDKSYYLKLKKYFKDKNIKDVSHLQSQAEILEISSPVYNDNGIALGMAIKHKKSQIFVMPGVPREMKGMINNQILPLFINSFHEKIIKHMTLLTTGIYESRLYDMLKNTIKLNKDNFKVSFLPNYTGVKIRLSIINSNVTKKDFLKFKEDVLSRIDKYVYGYDKDKIEEVVSNILKKKKLTISVAESCTGGYLSKKFTNVAGSSKFFKGGVIAYSNSIKIDILDISKKLLNEKGAVSEEVALKMAEGIKNKFNTNIGISTTGISGPDGGSIEKPVGLVYIAIVTKKDKIIKKFNLIPNRSLHRDVTVHTALNILRLSLK